jgi:protein TonB
MAALPPHPPEAQADRDTNGNPYLNAVMAIVMRNWRYPPLAKTLGLTGTTVLEILVDREGKIHSIKVMKSSGADILDRAAIQSFRDSAPLPPPTMPPRNFPGALSGIVITATVRAGPP